MEEKSDMFGAKIETDGRKREKDGGMTKKVGEKIKIELEKERDQFRFLISTCPGYTTYMHAV